MANRFGCVSLNFPFIYLGSMVVDNMDIIDSLKEVVKKLTSKLTDWKAKSLSIGTRLTLVKAFLGSLPTCNTVKI